jgi:dihydroorotase
MPGEVDIRSEKAETAKGLKEKAEKSGALVTEISPSAMAFPTGFDLQVHLRYPGQSDRETLSGGLNSALIGGYDTIVTMPNTDPFLDDPQVLAKAIKDCQQASVNLGIPVTTLFTAAGTKGMKGDEASDIPALVAAGAVAITDDGWGVRSPEAMRKILESCRDANVAFLQHAEMPGHKGHASPSEFQRKHSIPAYPRTVESQMVARDIELLESVKGARYHVLHVSTRETLDVVRRAKESGLDVTCEVSPHHLYFSNQDIPAELVPERVNSFKMNPPLFDPEDRDALIEGLANGLIDFVSTDHAPHRSDAKATEWALAPFGTRGMETALPVLVGLMWQGRISASRLVEVWSSKAREFLPSKAGAKGLVFLDPARDYLVDAFELPGISRNSCFFDHRLRGRIDMRGEVGTFFARPRFARASK